MLKNGTYTLNSNSFATALNLNKDGVTYRAETPHQAILKAHPQQTSILVRITCDTCIVRDLVFETRKIGGTGVLLEHSNGAIIEHNILRNGGLTLNAGAHNGIARHNLIENSPGEANYWGPEKANVPPGMDYDPAGITNFQFYGNTVRNSGMALLDIKGGTNYDIHHNIFENQQRGAPLETGGSTGGEQMISWGGSTVDSAFSDNIIRNSDGPTLIVPLDEYRNNTLQRNVFYGNQNEDQAVKWVDGTQHTTQTILTANTFCTNGDRDVCERQAACSTTVKPAGLTISNNNGLNFTGSGNINPGGAAQAACDAEVSRILAEMATLPGL